jgi:hypothetical protein
MKFEPGTIVIEIVILTYLHLNIVKLQNAHLSRSELKVGGTLNVQVHMCLIWGYAGLGIRKDDLGLKNNMLPPTSTQVRLRNVNQFPLRLRVRIRRIDIHSRAGDKPVHIASSNYFSVVNKLVPDLSNHLTSS